jgi:phospholipid/cholesterol/gamma-HCH transport system substrate-binding protein
METRANYVLIGAFTLFSLLAGLGFFLWLAQFELDRRLDYYDVLFDNVSGLTRGGEVRFNGVLVGQVISFGFDREDPTQVRTRIEVSADTPVTEDVEAQLQSQGVTGVSFVALTSRDPEARLLREVTDEPVPTIRGRPSTFDALIQDAPDILSQTLSLLQQLGEFVGPQNQAAVQQILSNFAAATGRLDEALDDFGQISAQVRDATDILAAFTQELGPLTLEVERVAVSASQALSAATGALTAAEFAIAEAPRSFSRRGCLP